MEHPQSLEAVQKVLDIVLVHNSAKHKMHHMCAVVSARHGNMHLIIEWPNQLPNTHMSV